MCLPNFASRDGGEFSFSFVFEEITNTYTFSSYHIFIYSLTVECSPLGDLIGASTQVEDAMGVAVKRQPGWCGVQSLERSRKQTTWEILKDVNVSAGNEEKEWKELD